jgi:pseudaminic acid cytidylyltransferase
MNIAVIPARGGSKRIPRKNIKLFAGRPMIWYAISAARASGLFEHVIVSTDDVEIAAIADEGGAEVPFMRPAELADDHTGTAQVISDAIRRCEALGWRATHICCIYPCVPFLLPEDLRTGLQILQSSHADYCFPVAEFPSPIQRALRRNANGVLEPFNPDYQLSRTQDLETAHFDAGQFYWGTSHAWLHNPLIHSNARSLIIPTWRVVDVDTADDWSRAELLQPIIAARMSYEGSE